MLLAILTIGGAILGATTIAGTLMLYQIRAATDAENSAKAIFAADTAVQWVLFDFYCNAPTTPRCIGTTREQTLPGNPPGTLANGAAASATCNDAEGSGTLCSSTTTAISATAVGVSASSTWRAFYVNLANATATYP